MRLDFHSPSHNLKDKDVEGNKGSTQMTLS